MGSPSPSRRAVMRFRRGGKDVESQYSAYDCGNKHLSVSGATGWVDRNQIDFSAETRQVGKLDRGPDQRNVFAGNTLSEYDPGAVVFPQGGTTAAWGGARNRAGRYDRDNRGGGPRLAENIGTGFFHGREIMKKACPREQRRGI